MYSCSSNCLINGNTVRHTENNFNDLVYRFCRYDKQKQGRPQGHFAPGPSLKGAPGGPMKGPLNTCLKDQYTLIEQSDLNTLIEQSQYSSEEQCSKLIDKEIWLVMGSYCHCQQVVTFFFFFWSSPYNLGEGPHFNSLPWAP